MDRPTILNQETWCLLKDEQLKRSHWPKAVVLDVFPDKTGLVRRVRVKTAYATMMRDIRKLCLLEAANQLYVYEEFSEWTYCLMFSRLHLSVGLDYSAPVYSILLFSL